MEELAGRKAAATATTGDYDRLGLLGCRRGRHTEKLKNASVMVELEVCGATHMFDHAAGLDGQTEGRECRGDGGIAYEC